MKLKRLVTTVGRFSLVFALVFCMGAGHVFAATQAHLLSTTMPAGRVFYANDDVEFNVTIMFNEAVEPGAATLRYDIYDWLTDEPVVSGRAALQRTLPMAAVAAVAPDLPNGSEVTWYRMELSVTVGDVTMPVRDRDRRGEEAVVAFGKFFKEPGTAATSDAPADAQLLTSGRQTSTIGDRVDPARQVMAFYYPWYGNPDVSGRWVHWPEGGHNPDNFDRNGLPPIGAGFHPVLGPYDSRDSRVLQWHLAWAEQAGIDVLISSWWAPGDFTDHALGELLDAAADTSVKIALYYEDNPEGTPERFANDIRYLMDRYGDHPAMFKHEGAVVIYVFDRAVNQLSYEQWQRLMPTIKADYDVLFIADREDRVWSELFDGLHSYNPIGRIAGGASVQSLFDAIVWEAESQGKLSAVAVLPGYEDTNIGRANPIPVSRRDGELYDEMWQAAIASLPTWIVVTSFNEWHEGSQIEPSLEHGDAYLHRTAEWAERFHATPERTFWVEQRSLPEVAQAAHHAPITLHLRRIQPTGNIDVKWDLPEGWSYIGSRPAVLGSQMTMTGNLRVPRTAEPGRYPISLKLSLGDYHTEVTSVVTVPDPDAAPPFEGLGVWTILGDPNLDYGIRQKDDGDGVTEAVVVDGVSARKTAPGVSDGKYMYFDVADSFLHNVSGVDVELGIEYLDEGDGTIWVQYDSHNPEGDLNGAYTNAYSFDLQGSGEWKFVTVPLEDVRFANRQNAATDFRFGAGTGDLIVRQVYIKVVE